MKDYADKSWLKEPLTVDSLEYKRERARALLDQLGINRARVECGHKYTNSVGKTILLPSK